MANVSAQVRIDSPQADITSLYVASWRTVTREALRGSRSQHSESSNVSGNWHSVNPWYKKLIRVNLFGMFGSVNAKRSPDTPSAANADTAPNALTLALAYWLNLIKTERGLSQRGFAALTGLSQAYSARVLKGDANVGLGMLAVIAGALGKDPLDLIKPPPSTRSAKKRPSRN
jgi:hypothetical protein